MGMNINLTPQLEELVRSKVASGLYTSASEVVREALRLMDEQDRLREAKLEQLRSDVRRGLDSGPSETWDAKAVKRRARTRRASKPAAA
jgi:antitoxin ParD1/3/4